LPLYIPVCWVSSMITTHSKFALRLKDTKWFLVSLQLSESSDVGSGRILARPPVDLASIEFSLRSESAAWLRQETEIASDSLLLNRVMDRSLRDLGALRSRLGEASYFAAGVPWFVALFGRASLITAVPTLAYDP